VHLVETRALIGDRGAYRMTEAPEACRSQDGSGILAARIDRLTRGQATPSGGLHHRKDVPFTLLKSIADMTEESVHRDSPPPASEFSTRRASSRISNTLQARPHPRGDLRQRAPDRRRALHARIVEAIETLHRSIARAGRAPGAPCVPGELWEKAFTYLRTPATRLYPLGLPGGRTRFEQALEALHPCPLSAPARSGDLSLRRWQASSAERATLAISRRRRAPTLDRPRA